MNCEREWKNCEMKPFDRSTRTLNANGSHWRGAFAE